MNFDDLLLLLALLSLLFPVMILLLFMLYSRFNASPLSLLSSFCSQILFGLDFSWVLNFLDEKPGKTFFHKPDKTTSPTSDAVHQNPIVLEITIIGIMHLNRCYLPSQQLHADPPSNNKDGHCRKFSLGLFPSSFTTNHPSLLE